MNKIVLDTNIFIAALISNRGASFKILEELLVNAEKNIKVNCTSVPLILELEDVMFREKNRTLYSYLNDEDLNLLIDDIVLISNKTKLNYLWRPFLKDKDDDRVLETAFNSSSKYIVTHNIKDFQGVEEKFDIKVITPKEYLEKGELK